MSKIIKVHALRRERASTGRPPVRRALAVMAIRATRLDQDPPATARRPSTGWISISGPLTSTGGFGLCHVRPTTWLHWPTLHRYLPAEMAGSGWACRSSGGCVIARTPAPAGRPRTLAVGDRACWLAASGLASVLGQCRSGVIWRGPSMVRNAWAGPQPISGRSGRPRLTRSVRFDPVDGSSSASTGSSHITSRPAQPN